jgi:hypothetical protein
MRARLDLLLFEAEWTWFASQPQVHAASIAELFA